MLDEGGSGTLAGAPLGAEQLAGMTSLPQSLQPAPASSPLTTMQGTETSLPESPPPSRWGSTARAKRLRIGAIIACALFVVPVAVLGARKAGVFGATAPNPDSPEGALQEARDCMKRRAWDTPGRNFRSVTDAALARWPEDPAFVAIRHEAAAALVTEAFARKYDSDPVDASRLADLALYFDPSLTVAQRLSQELTAARVADAAPPSSAAPDRDKGKRPRDARLDAKGGGRPVTAPASTAGTSGTGTPPPTSRPPADGPRPASTGPWL